MNGGEKKGVFEGRASAESGHLSGESPTGFEGAPGERVRYRDVVSPTRLDRSVGYAGRGAGIF